MQTHLTFFCSFTLNLIYFIHLPLLIRLIYLKKKNKNLNFNRNYYSVIQFSFLLF